MSETTLTEESTAACNFILSCNFSSKNLGYLKETGHISAVFSATGQFSHEIRGAKEQSYVLRQVKAGYPSTGNIPCVYVSIQSYISYVLTEKDKQWISERLDKVETTLLTEFHKWHRHYLRPKSHAAALRAMDAEVESLSDRLKKLENR